MKVYQTDADGYLVGTTLADKDPLGGGWLIPAGCVSAEPPSVSAEQIARWTGNGWAVEPIVIEEEPQPEIMSAEEEIRANRNGLLAASDWTQVDDAKVDKAAWAAYRQALRDITAQAGFPNDIIWPTNPTEATA